MADPRVEKLARVLVEYSTRVRAGDLVLLSGPRLAEPLLRELFRRVLAVGGHPYVHLELEELEEALYAEGGDRQLDWVDPAARAWVEQADVRIRIEAAANPRRLTQTEPARHARAGRAWAPFRNRVIERYEEGRLRWLVTAFPTNGLAQEAGMSLADYEDFVFRAGWLDREDPVSEWRAFGNSLARLAERCSSWRELRVVADGVDLTLGVQGRTWIASDGRENFPDGEIFTGPVETATEGEVRFTFPANHSGRVIEGIRLRFRDGRVVDASAVRGEDFLHEMLELDEGARRLGEFAFGLNDAITEATGNTLFDEKIGGTVHVALGMSYPESGGVNTSSLHWDIVRELWHGGEVYADGELVYRDGRFLDGAP
jgi:aminopeptidase